MKTKDIRKAFIDYFHTKGHHVVASSPLVPGNDATLLFTNAGMVQFKDVFLGTDARAYTRATTSQRCVRAGGKHNDLENVGYTARHHTLFEMLGNFSFGDYFKRDAIKYAWEFLTQVLKLPPEKLWVTVYKDDDETADIWLKEMGVSETRFSRCGEKDNFWSMGDTGPCGPCTEIFFDHGPEIAGGPPGSPDEDGDRYIEIWNLVFMQYNRDKNGELHPLPKPSVDTGMGLERITAVVQGVHTNYDIDIFKVLINAIYALNPSCDKTSPSLKVIADHIRACAFLIADGVLPSNEGRGYVLRRIIRRAVRHGNQLHLPLPFFYQLVDPLIETMADAYPELKNNRATIERVLKQEENQFAKTLELGLALLASEIAGLTSKIIPGEVAFKLYDTYGFPIDLTADIARERDLVVDMDGFNRCMDKQRSQSQAASQFSVDYSEQALWTESSKFCGYDKTHVEGIVLEMREAGKPVKTIKALSQAVIVLDKTTFYAESGGQVGDVGFLKGNGIVFRVTHTEQSGQAILHKGELIEGELHIHDRLMTEYDIASRDATRLNHSATHLLHAALKSVVGTHVQQKGSLVEPTRARFDFSHFEALTPKQLAHVEAIVNAEIRANHHIVTETMSLEMAKQSQAVALFGEKYGDDVRVLSMGDFSKELCGGTHAFRTGDIGLFKITAEYGIASGVRRIELVTGQHALAWVNHRLSLLDEAALKLKANASDINDKLSQFLLESKHQEKELTRLKAEMAMRDSASMVNDVEEINGIKVLIKQLDIEASALREMMDSLRSRLVDSIIVLFSISGDKLSVVAGVSKTLLDKAPKASVLVQHLCGKGGGRDDMAQGGGDVPPDLAQKIQEIKGMLG